MHLIRLLIISSASAAVVSGLRLQAEPLPDINIPVEEAVINEWNKRIRDSLPPLMKVFDETPYDVILRNENRLPKMNATQRKLKAAAEPGWLIDKIKGLDANPSPHAFWKVWHEAATRLRMVQLGLDADALAFQDLKQEVPTSQFYPQMESLNVRDRRSGGNPERNEARQISGGLGSVMVLGETVLPTDGGPRQGRREEETDAGKPGAKGANSTCSGVAQGAHVYMGDHSAGFNTHHIGKDDVIDVVGEPGYNCYMDSDGKLCAWAHTTSTTEKNCQYEGYTYKDGTCDSSADSTINSNKDYSGTARTDGVCCWTAGEEYCYLDFGTMNRVGITPSTLKYHENWGRNLSLVPKLSGAEFNYYTKTSRTACEAGNAGANVGNFTWYPHWWDFKACVTYPGRGVGIGNTRDNAGLMDNAGDEDTAKKCWTPGYGWSGQAIPDRICEATKKAKVDANACIVQDFQDDWNGQARVYEIVGQLPDIAQAAACYDIATNTRAPQVTSQDQELYSTAKPCDSAYGKYNAAWGQHASDVKWQWLYDKQNYVLTDCNEKEYGCINSPAKFHISGNFYMEGEKTDGSDVLIFDGRDSATPYIDCSYGWSAFQHIKLEKYKTGLLRSPRRYSRSYGNYESTGIRKVGIANAESPKFYLEVGDVTAPAGVRTVSTINEDSEPYFAWFGGWDCFGPFNTDFRLISESDEMQNYASAGLLVVQLQQGLYGKNFTDQDKAQEECTTACAKYFTPGCFLVKRRIFICEDETLAGCTAREKQLSDTEFEEEVINAWVCGVCDPPLYYLNITDYIFQRPRTSQLPWYAWGLPLPFSEAVNSYNLYLFGYSEDPGYNSDPTKKSGQGTWWLPDAKCTSAADTTLIATEQMKLSFMNWNTTALRYSSSTRDEHLKYYTRKNLDGLSDYEKHVNVYMKERWHCMQQCMERLKGALGSVKTGCELEMSMKLYRDMPGLFWPHQQDEKRRMEVSTKTYGAWDSAAKKWKTYQWKSTPSSGLKLQCCVVGYSTAYDGQTWRGATRTTYRQRGWNTDCQKKNTDWTNAGSPRLWIYQNRNYTGRWNVMNSAGVESQAREEIRGGTMLSSTSTQKLLSAFKSINGKSGDCTSKLNQHVKHQRWYNAKKKKYLDVVWPRHYKVNFQQDPAYRQSYYELNCRSCSAGITAINSTARALDIIAADATYVKWANPNLFFGFDSSELRMKWAQQTVQDALSTSLGQATYKINGGSDFNSFWNTTTTLAALTRDDYLQLDENLSCKEGEKINAMVTVFYSSLQGASEMSGSVRHPVCSDGGAAVAINGAQMAALNIAMQNAVSAMSGESGACNQDKSAGGYSGNCTTDGGLAYEYEETGVELMKSILQGMSYVATQKAKVRSEDDKSHRRRRSYHRRRRAPPTYAPTNVPLGA